MILCIIGTAVDKDAASELLKALQPIASDWDLFGEQIGIPKHEVDRISADVGAAPNRVSKCLSDAMKWWLNNSPNPTYEMITKTLEGPVVPNRQLAKDITENFMGKTNYARLIRKWCDCRCMLI